MLLAGLPSGLEIVLVALATLVIVYRIWRSARLRNQRGQQDSLAEARADIRHAEQAEVTHVRQLEVRLHDYAREVEGRMESRIAMLDRLVEDADREIARLQQRLDLSRDRTDQSASPRQPDIVTAAAPQVLGFQPPSPAADSANAPPPISNQQYQTTLLLRDAGFDCLEIAHCVDLPADSVKAILDGERRDRAA